VPPPSLFAVITQAQQGEVIALGRPAREDYFLSLCADYGRHLIAGLLHRHLGPTAVFVSAAARVAKLFAEVVKQHRLHGGFERRGRVAIEVNRRGHLKCSESCMFILAQIKTNRLSISHEPSFSAIPTF
jgi:hypothetical protein